MDYRVFVRTYKRYDQVCTHTLEFLKQNDLLSVTSLVVADEEEKSFYEESLKKHGIVVDDIIVTCKGGGRSYDKLFGSLEHGTKMFLMDDDIKEMIEFYEGNSKVKRKVRNLKEYLEYGFRVLEEHEIKVFGFEYSNMFYKTGKEFATVGVFRFNGGFFGAINCPELITNFDHEDDNVRTSQILKKYGTILRFNWFGVSMAKIGKNPGGMQADGSRGDKDNTKERCELALKVPGVSDYFLSEPVFSEEFGFYTLKMKPSKDLKRLPSYRIPFKLVEYFDQQTYPPIKISLL